MKPQSRCVFVTGATGYLGRPLISELTGRGHSVRALARSSSLSKLPPTCDAIVGSALDAKSYMHQIGPCDTFIQLVGVPHPSPAKAADFRSVDFVSASEAIRAATEHGVEHFIYLSVAHPAPIMKAYVEVRSECEELLRQSGMKATILRPWYILGPGHRWPYALLPMYWVMEQIPPTRESAQRLGLVTLEQMTRALVGAVENPPHGVRIVEVPEIRASGAYSPVTQQA